MVNREKEINPVRGRPAEGTATTALGRSASNGVKTGDILKITGISKKQLYYWELKGAIAPEHITKGTREFKVYSEKDIHLLNEISGLLNKGITFNEAINSTAQRSRNQNKER